MNAQATAAREAARNTTTGQFGEQHLGDPGNNVLGRAAEPAPAALICGRCGCPVYEDHGSFVDETQGDGCGDGVHTGHRYDTPEVDELRDGDRIVWDGVTSTVSGVEADPASSEHHVLSHMPDDYIEATTDSLPEGTKLFRLTSPALTPYPMGNGEFGISGLICGTCGEPVIDWRGVYVDENKSTRCGTGHHTAVNSEVAGCDQIHAGDALIIDGERVIVDSIDSDHRSTSIEYHSANPFNFDTHIVSYGNDEVFDRVTSRPLPATTGITEGPDEHRFRTTAMVRAERALDGANPFLNDGDEVRQAAAVVNLMRARRLADYTLMLHPTAEAVALEPAEEFGGRELHVVGIRLADGSTISRSQLAAADQGTLDMLDGESSRLGEDGTGDWIRTCSASWRGVRHVMQLSEAARIDRIDLDRGEYDPARFDRH